MDNTQIEYILRRAFHYFIVSYVNIKYHQITPKDLRYVYVNAWMDGDVWMGKDIQQGIDAYKKLFNDLDIPEFDKKFCEAKVFANDIVGETIATLQIRGEYPNYMNWCYRMKKLTTIFKYGTISDTSDDAYNDVMKAWDKVWDKV